MQGQPLIKLSPKSRSILFRLKNTLKQKGFLLDTHIFNIFQYRKQKLNRKQFQKVIRKYDQNLILADIDEVFKQLDKDGKKYIRYTLLEKIFQQITQQDDPCQQLDRKSKSLAFNEQQLNQVFALIELKDALIQNDQYLQVIQLFITQKDGYLTKVNVRELLDNLQFRDQKKIQFIIKAVFQNNDRIELKQFLNKLDLGNDGTRIRLSDYSIQQSVILNNSKINNSLIKIDNATKSQFIKKQQNQRMSHEFNIEYSKILQALDELQMTQNAIHSGVYSLQKIPKALKPYFNYGSELEEPFAQLASNFIQNNLIFIDQQGPTYAKAKKWIHISQFNPNYFIFQVAESIIMRTSRQGLGMLLEPKDITQGKYGNCYFLSAIAAIIQAYPQLVYRLFVLQKNPSHIYGIRLFIDGVWKTIAVDGCFPLNQSGKFCGSQPHHNEIWVMLIEKAWAKVFKTYQNIHSGYNQQGLVAISGAPTQILLIKQQKFISTVHQQFKKGSIITCTTAKHVSQISIQQQQKLGVFAGHAYPILKIYDNIEVKNQNENGKITLLKMKNPWGTKAWKGDWSFNSKKWTKQLRTRLNYQIDSKDGTFFISLDDFTKYFDHINISKINLGNRNCHIVNNANRSDFYYNPVVITHPGHYFFTIYQDNGRKFKGSSGVYQKSPSWLFLAKIDKVSSTGEASFAAVAYNASAYHHSTVQADLTPGEYLLISKVSWNYWEQHPYVISSYGPGKVIFQPAQVAQLPILLQFIRARSQRHIRQKKATLTYYKDTKIWKCFHFQHTEGLGFLTIYNQQNIVIQSTLTLNPCKGIEILPPYTNPVVITAKPKEMVTAAFIIDPKGYSYKLMQGYKIYSIK